VSEELGALVREKWSSLLDEGFEIADEEQRALLLTSSVVTARIVLSPRGVMDVEVFPQGGDRLYGWTYTGMVGRASVGRLLEIALGQMREEPAILRGDADFYEALAVEKKARAGELNAYDGGRGPAPRGHLP
jgi:hypothetical protein